jgi:hypothetical protein
VKHLAATHPATPLTEWSRLVGWISRAFIEWSRLVGWISRAFIEWSRLVACVGVSPTNCDDSMRICAREPTNCDDSLRIRVIEACTTASTIRDAGPAAQNSVSGTTKQQKGPPAADLLSIWLIEGALPQEMRQLLQRLEGRRV